MTKNTIAPSATPLEQTAKVQLTQPISKTMKKRLERQKTGKENAQDTKHSRLFNNWALHFCILPESNIYKIELHKSNLRTYWLKNIALDKQNFSMSSNSNHFEP